MPIIYLKKSTEDVIETRLRGFQEEGISRRLVNSSWDPGTCILDAVWEYQGYMGAGGRPVTVNTQERIREIAPGIHQVDDLGTRFIPQGGDIGNP